MRGMTSQRPYQRPVGRDVRTLKATADAARRRRYAVGPEEKRLFREQGFVHLKGILSAVELRDVMEPYYVKFMSREVQVTGKDLCDMSGATDRTPETYTVYNAMLPRQYLPEMQGNIFEQRCQDIANQLCEGDMAIDYDQILAKRPETTDSIFAWHQDLAYWPMTDADQSTATCWLAMDDSTVQNGCMRFIPGSHLECVLRPHTPVDPTRKDSHVLSASFDPDRDTVFHAEIQRGDITVHNERVVHGSGPNLSKNWRRAYVLAFRKRACVQEERALGFTHSHNDVKSWDAFHQHQ